jgi:hypothetical protein
MILTSVNNQTRIMGVLSAGIEFSGIEGTGIRLNSSGIVTGIKAMQSSFQP